MAIAFRAIGTVVTSLTAITPAPHASHVTGDIELLFVESSNEAVTLSTAAGFAAVPGTGTGVGTAAGTDGTRMTVFWRRWNGTDGSPTVADSGNHQIGVIASYSGGPAAGNPWDVVGTNQQTPATTAGSASGVTTTVASTLIVIATAGAQPDAISTTEFSAWTNAALGSLTERLDQTDTVGNGGAIGIADGTKATAGATGATAFTSVTSTTKDNVVIALKNSGGGASSILPSAIASAEVFGTPVLVAGVVALNPSAIVNGVFGTPTLVAIANILPSSIVSSEVFGTATILVGAVKILPSAIGSAEAFSTPTLVATAIVSPSGIAASAGAGGAFQTNAFQNTAFQTGTGAAVGTPIIQRGLSPVAIASGEAFGNPTLIPGPVQILPSSIASAEVFGATVLKATNNVLPSAIPAPDAISTIAQDNFEATTPGVDLAGQALQTGGNWSSYWLPSGSAQIRVANRTGSGQQWFRGTGAGTTLAPHYRAGTGTDGDVDLYFTVYQIAPQLQGGIWFRGISPGTLYRLQARPNGSSVLLESFVSGSNTTVASGTMAAGDWDLHVQVIGSSPTTIRARWWAHGGVEPSTWNIDTTDNTAANQVAAGAYGIMAVGGLGGDFTGDDFRVTTGVPSLGTPTIVRSSPSTTILPTGIPSAEASGNHTLLPGGVTVAPSGIPTAEVVGTPSLIASAVILPTAIASAEAFGTHVLKATSIISPTGISTGEVVGVPTLLLGGVLIQPAAIASAEAFGTPVVGTLARVLPSAIGSAEALGTPSLVAGGVLIQPTGVVSGEAFGTPIVSSGGLFIAPSGIASAEAFGIPFLRLSTLSVVAIPSGEAFGTPTLIPTAKILPSAIASGESFAPVVLKPVSTISPTGIASAEALGNPTLKATAFILPSSITTGEVVPVPSLSAGVQFISPTAIASAESFGSHALLHGQVTVSPAGIVSAEALGLPVILPGATRILPSGVTSGETVNSPTLIPVSIVLPVGITSGELLGLPIFIPTNRIVVEGIAPAEALGLPRFIITQFINPNGILSQEMFGIPHLKGAKNRWRWIGQSGFADTRQGGWPETQDNQADTRDGGWPETQEALAGTAKSEGET